MILVGRAYSRVSPAALENLSNFRIKRLLAPRAKFLTPFGELQRTVPDARRLRPALPSPSARPSSQEAQGFQACRALSVSGQRHLSPASWQDPLPLPPVRPPTTPSRLQPLVGYV